MLKYTAFALFFSTAAILQAETVELGNHGLLELEVPSGWKLGQKQIPDLGYNLSLTPLSDVNAKCIITIIYPPKAALIDKEKLRGQLNAASQRFVPGSVEQKVEIREYSLPTGYGIYATFTDKDLVGKPQKRGDYKVMNPGLIQFSDDVIATVTVFSDDAGGPEQKVMIHTVAAINFKPVK